ncbi:MAG: sigma-70 family RNA polymerase sigma factor [Actinobacteria bacterium]|nr:MAG: sigma-70 family RNA polymerase sigma factor [Actinomycetota bacterium]
MAERDDVLETMFALHYRRLLRYAYLLTRGRGAEDLVQEAFLKALRKWDRSAAPETFYPWCQTTLTRLHLNALRRGFRERRAYQRHGEDDVHHDPEGRDPLVMQALATLPPRQRAATVLRYYEDLSVNEIAERMGAAEGTIKALLHQARQRLQIELGPREGYD